MKKKESRLGLLVIVLVFGVCMIGCSSVPNFYNFGNVSEDNCAYILVAPIYDESYWPLIEIVQINGQGTVNQWQKPFTLMGVPRAVVRVTPDECTFTVTFIRTVSRYNLNTGRDEPTRREIPVSVTYNVEAGKGYFIRFNTRVTGPTPTDPTVAELILFEDITNDGNFGGYNSLVNGKEVARTTETFYVTTGDLGL